MAHYKIAFCVSLERNHSKMTVGHARLGMRRLQRTCQRLTVALIAAVFLGTPLVSAKSRTPQKKSAESVASPDIAEKQADLDERVGAADRDEVLAAWAGLGYYARARNLHACAQVVVRRHRGNFPSQEAELRELPGIGQTQVNPKIELNFATALRDAS